MYDMLKRLKFVKTKDAAIKQAVKEFNKVISKTYRKIEKTGYPENPGSIAETVIRRFLEQDSL